ncbi:MAG: Glycosyl transferase family 2 [candidate division WS6 bacterium GW2011_GWF1_35_23]|uniref:Glycosyl transferase family 2 n=1 Tax=candidate division WS6 bacterium GW2011_GWF1_35_23 TaxID=1619097 RepID=A0A0G0EH12_9BACT|nr:MAG: Glycosyl transferase family 2 [candidate division WS6 bacterium GW2011_GWF1_35_23]
MKLVVFSICQNEGKTIGELLDRIPKKIDGIDDIEVMVVDDGSTDDTVKIAKEKGAVVYSNLSQKRLAYSFQYAVDKVLKMGADIAVNIDGDLQFAPEEIPLLVKPILDGKADFVPEFMSKGKYWGNRIGAFVIGSLSKKKFSDVTCGFRAYNRDALLHMNINNKFTYTQEAFQLLASKQLNIRQVPISIKYFKGRKSRVVSSIFSFISLSAFNILRVFRDFAPLKFFGILGLVPFLIGLACVIFLGMHWLNTGDFSPYKFVGFTGLYLITLGIIVWLFGMLSDILGRIINNQEKTLYITKKIYYSKFKKKE